MSSSKRPDTIRRRDFLNGLLMGAGGAALAGLTPMKALAAGGICDPTINVNSDPRAMRAGDLRSTFSVGHWLRDGRLTFGSNFVEVAPSPRDTVAGRFDVVPDGGTYDVIVVGSGISGLSTAFFLSRRRPGTRVLVLDGGPVPGGAAARDDAPPIPMPSSAGGAYAVAPYSDYLQEMYSTVGLDWTQHALADPVYSYFFDQQCPDALPGVSSWNVDTYGKGLSQMPYPAAILHDLQQAKQDFRNWYTRAGAPTDPADSSDPRYDWLAHITLEDYLRTERGFHPAVSDFYTRYAVDALAGRSQDVSAYTSISFLGAEYNPLWALPGGTSGIVRHLLHHLIPGAIAGSTTADIIANPIVASALDAPNQPVRVRTQSMALHADTAANDATVTYYRGGTFYSARARAVVLAGQGHTAQHLIEHLSDAPRRAAFDSFVSVPVAVANVVVKSAAPLVNLGLGYNNYWWGSKYWADFVVADWIGAQRLDPNRPTVLTFYGGNFFPPEEMAAERRKLLTTPFCSYEDSLREDLNRILASAGFDFDRDVSDVYLYRWGHGMVYPVPGFAHGVPLGAAGQAVRTAAPRHVARAQLGRISIAGQDTESSPAIESAIASGLRAATEALAVI